MDFHYFLFIYFAFSSALQVEQRLPEKKKADRKASTTSETARAGNTDALPYHEFGTNVYFEISLSRPLIERVRLSDLQRELQEMDRNLQKLLKLSFRAGSG